MAKETVQATKSAGLELGAGDAVATIGVRSVKASRKFYEDALGLEVADVRGDAVVTYKSGGSRVFVYESEFGGTNKATSVTWVSEDVDAVVANLKARGVTFEHYAMPHMQIEGDVHVSGSMRAAWFKDPDGNVLGIVNAG